MLSGLLEDSIHHLSSPFSAFSLRATLLAPQVPPGPSTNPAIVPPMPPMSPPTTVPTTGTIDPNVAPAIAPETPTATPPMGEDAPTTTVSTWSLAFKPYLHQLAKCSQLLNARL